VLLGVRGVKRDWLGRFPIKQTPCRGVVKNRTLRRAG
jgi:hypothetical protein